MSTPDATSASIRTRRVYYISGCDPRGPAYYHRMYRDEAALQMQHHEGSLVTGSRERVDTYVSRWSVQAQWGTDSVNTEYQFLAWDDLVRELWSQSTPRLLLACARGAVQDFRSGFFARIRKTFNGALLSFSYVGAVVLFSLFASLLAGVLIAAGLGLFAGLGWWSVVPGVASAYIGYRISVSAWRRVGIFWLLRIYQMVHMWAEKGFPALETRMDQFAERIVREQQARPCDEVLIVGHSIGCTVAALVAARVAQRLASEERQNMSLVTLGHCMQFLTLMPGADRVRADLHTLAQATDLPWFDMIARADSLCFWQANPLAESGVDKADAARPITQVVRPFRMFASADYARIRRNRLRLHFQYVMASAFPNEYDYFRMTAGPTRLRAY